MTAVKKVTNTEIYRIAMALMTMFMIITKLYRLGSVYEAIYVDEAGLMYNVKSIIENGVDISNASYPIYLNNFEIGQSALYTYLCVIISAIIGVSLFSLRLPAVIFSMITYYFGLLIVKEIYENNKKINMMYTVIFATVPYFFMSSRIALDCNLMLGMSTIVLWTIIKIYKTGKFKYYIMLGVSVGLTLYTYAVSHVVMPLFLIMVMIIAIKKKLLTVKKFIGALVPMVVLAIPLVVFHIINQFGLENVVIGPVTIPILGDYRGTAFSSYERSFGVRLFKVFVSTFLTDGRFMDGDFPYYTFYMFSWIFGCLGFAKMLVDIIKRKRFEKLIIVLFTFSVIAVMLTLSDFECCTIYRMNAVFICFALYILEGILVCFFNCITSRKVIAIALLYGISFMFFLNSYFNANPKEGKDNHLYSNLYPEVIEYVSENNTENRDVIFVANINQPQIYFYLSADVKVADIKEICDVKEYTYRGTNYFFEKKSEYEKECIYILEEKNNADCELLKENGYDVLNIDGCYVCIP